MSDSDLKDKATEGCPCLLSSLPKCNHFGISWVLLRYHQVPYKYKKCLLELNSLIETWLKPDLEIKGFGKPLLLDRDPWRQGNLVGDSACQSTVVQHSGG